MDINKLHGSIYALPEAAGNFMENAQKKVVFAPERFWPDYVMRCWILAPNAGDTKPHQHPWPHWMVVIKGTGHHSIDGKEFDSKPGDWIFVPSDVDHYFNNPSDTENLEILCTVPPEGDINVNSLKGC